jgi:hypothetical protein
VGHIARWITSWASLKATGCCHRVSACIALHRHGGRHGQRFWLKTQHTNKKLAFSYLTYGKPKPKAMRISYPKLDPLVLSSLMQQALFKCEMPWLVLKSSATFLCIKRCEGTKIGKVINRNTPIRFGREQKTPAP